MSHSFTFQTTLWSGTTSGPITYQIGRHNVMITMIPRNLIEACKQVQELQTSGIYFLTDSSTNNPHLYIGQTTLLSGNDGVINHICENELQKDSWDTAFLINTIKSSWEAEELNYLKNAFCHQGQKRGINILKNTNASLTRDISEDKKGVFHTLVHEIFLVLSVSGYNVFKYTTSMKKTKTNPDAANQSEINSPPTISTDEVFCIQKRGKILARARYATNTDGKMKFEVFSGTIVDPSQYKPKGAKEIGLAESLAKARSEYRESKKLQELKIIEPIHFSDHSEAAYFVLGIHADKNPGWVLESNSNMPLKEFLKRIKTKQN